jgi:PAT family beta-lactamase induction signal transducer AmpG
MAGGEEQGAAAARERGAVEDDGGVPGIATRGPRRPWSSPATWVSTTYFAEGFPYSIVNNLAEILFKELGASLQVIGLTALFHLPWNLKFLWGPFLDQYETKRAWLIAVEVLLSVLLLVLALVVGASPSLLAIAACVALLAFLSATHDIAIDGYYLEGLGESDQSRYVGYRAAAYRVAGLTVASPLLLLIGVAGWRTGLLAATVVMLLLTAYHALFLPRAERRRLSAVAALRDRSVQAALIGVAALAGVAIAAVRLAPSGGLVADALGALGRSGFLGISLAGWISIVLLLVLVGALLSLDRIRTRLAGRDSPYAAAFVDFLAQRRIGLVLLFIVTFRVGESFLTKMRWPFLHDVLGMTISEYAWANGTLGTIASFAATFVGGRLIARDGLRRWIWPFVLAQNVLNLLFVWLAWLGAEGAGQVLTVAVIGLEQFGAGLGTAVFMVYLMRCCAPEHRAAHMAIVTALMSVSFTLAGVGSGFLAASMGFGPYFLFTFLVTIPGMALLFFLPHLDGREEPSRA